MLEDVQNRRDDRHLPIDEVGITGIRYPVAVLDREHGKQDTIADVRMSVDLSPEIKGTHLSRFVEILDDVCGRSYTRHHADNARCPAVPSGRPPRAPGIPVPLLPAPCCPGYRSISADGLSNAG